MAIYTDKISKINEAFRFLREGALTVVDSEVGHQTVDMEGIVKLRPSLLARAKKEGKEGLVAFPDRGSFMMFRRAVAER